MYASLAAVRLLCRNRRSALSDDEIAAAAGLVDSDIDSALSALFWWPEGQDGADLREAVPTVIASVANYLTAALIELQTYAPQEASGMTANPYGASLQRRGQTMLAEIVAGRRLVPELVRTNGLASTPRAPAFNPIRGNLTRGGTWRS